MLNYILYDDFFIIILTFLFATNFILNNLTEIKVTKNIINKKTQMNKTEHFKEKTIDFFIIIFSIILLYILLKQKILYLFFLFITTLSYFARVLKNYIKSALYLDYENKQNYIFTTCIFSVLFSAGAYSKYTTLFAFIPHYTKEILLLIYLVTKIVFLIFFILINVSIIISNIQLLFGNRISKLIKSLKCINTPYKPRYYNFYFSSKENKKLFLFIDKIIFIISCPYFIILNIITKILLVIFNKLIHILVGLYQFLLNYDNNRNIIIKRVLKISLIVSFVIVYISVIYEKNIFSNEIMDIYNLIITVILIPIIYDSIRSK